MVTAQHLEQGYETISVNGVSVSARHFTVVGANREDVWLDNRGIPVIFSTVEDGTPSDFVLENATAAAGATTVASMKRRALALP